jgi:LysM repeat protein
MRRVLRALVGVTILAVLLVGLPVGLLAVGRAVVGVDFLHEITSNPSRLWDDFVGRGSAPLLLAVLIAVGLVLWASFAVSTLLEVAAMVGKFEAPSIPALGWAQGGAAVLLGLIVLSAPATQSVASAATTGPARPVSTQSVSLRADQLSTPDLATAPTVDAAPVAQAPAQAPAAQGGPTITTVRGDSLWRLAQGHLGDGMRWKEIVALNADRVQHDGDRLSMDNPMLPVGWVLQLPADAVNVPAADPQTGTEEIKTQPGDTLSGLAATYTGDASKAGELAAATAPIAQPDGRHLTNPDDIGVGWTVRIPNNHPAAAPPPAADDEQQKAAAAEQLRKAAEAATQAQAQREAAAAQHPTPAPAPDPANTPAPDAAPTPAPVAPVAPDRGQHYTTASPGGDTGSNTAVRTTTGVGAILAAGVLGLLANRRRNQQRRRAPGTTIPMPTGAAAATEHALRATAAPLDITTVDLALRSLAWHCHTSDQPLPYVRAARLTRDQFELYLGDPAELPAPWTSTSDPTVWTLPTDLDDDELITDEQAGEIAAPYPSLVTIGHDLEDAHILLDLEEAGALGLVGAPGTTRAVLTALALELAKSTWADDLQVTVVGACEDLEENMDTGRIRYLPDAGSIITDLNQRAAQDRDILAEVDTPDLQHARPQGTVPGIYTPEIVLIAGDITEGQREALAGLIEELPRVAVAAVTSGTPVGTWSLTMSDEDDTALLAPIGLTLRPQRVEEDTYRDLIEMMVVSGSTGAGVDTVEEPTVADLPAPAPSADEQITDPAEDISGHNEEATAGAEAAEEAPEDTGDIVAEGVETDAEAQQEAEAGQRQHTESAPEVAAQVHQLRPTGAPRILVLGPVRIVGARNGVADKDRGRATELAAFLALNPGVDHVAIDAAMWPGKIVTTNARNTAMSKLRRWLGDLTPGQPFLPRYSKKGGYRFHVVVATDWHQFQELLPHASGAPTDNLEQALTLVRGRPFADAKPRYYAFAEETMQEMIAAIVDAAYELGRRRLHEGAWQQATTAATHGLTVEPGMERLWRIRILAAHASGNTTATTDAIDRMHAITDKLGGDLEDATEQLLADLSDSDRPRRDHLAAYAL